MSKQTNTTEAPKKAQGPKLQLKESFMKGYNFLMFLAPAVAAYIFVVNGNSTELKVLASVLLVDAAVHVWKLIAVVK